MKEKHVEKSYSYTINITGTNIIVQAAAEDLFQGQQSGEEQKIPAIHSLNGILAENQRVFQQYILPSLGLPTTRPQHTRDAGKR